MAPPMSKVGPPSTKAPSTMRSKLPAKRPKRALPPISTYTVRTSHSNSGDRAASSAAPSSSIAYSPSGRVDRSARGPNNNPPAPSPPMNTASTAAVAAVLAPNTKRNSRSQATW